ncbi:unnamed protein product [Sphenostylis stenocarpa]|uniref:Uncharacterized protein n=1 Tax=Sphenostylis stenocarpa TaxID=92480 RepID=A0AA86V0Q8_9FABA|nr:unnamed protein product [Sphenostylis stenocarpa]
MASATLFALFLVSALTLYPPSATAQPVTDMYGNVVRNGGRFHILPYIFSNGGGIDRIATGNETIPLTVVQSPFETSKGLPLRITSIFRSGHIPEGSIVFVKFELIPLGDTSLEWTVVEGLPEGSVVKVSGYPNTVKGSFSIHRDSSSPDRYKLLFCNVDRSLCGNVGIARDDAGNRLLVITQDKPFVFVLEELASPSTASA